MHEWFDHKRGLAMIEADILGKALWCVRLASDGIVVAGTAHAFSARHSASQDSSEKHE